VADEDVLGGVAGFEHRSLCGVEDVAFVLVVVGGLFEEF
jgi:hypothetical protein